MNVLEAELLRYGYLFILLGSIAEGDATLLTAAFLAHRGYFRPDAVILVAATATILADHAYFLLARRKGAQWVASQRPDSRIGRAAHWARSRGALLLLASRFIIGMRTLAPAVCGATGMPSGSFVVWNVTGALLWAGVFGAAGYLGGHVLTLAIEDIRQHELWIAALIAAVVLTLVLWRTHGKEWRDIAAILRRGK